jgi:hypothetical protein
VSAELPALLLTLPALGLPAVAAGELGSEELLPPLLLPAPKRQSSAAQAFTDEGGALVKPDRQPLFREKKTRLPARSPLTRDSGKLCPHATHLSV